MKIRQFAVCRAVGQQPAKAEENRVDANNVDVLTTGGRSMSPRPVICSSIAQLCERPAGAPANPDVAPASVSSNVRPLRKKSSAVGTDFFETCKWGDGEEEEKEYREYLVWRVQKDDPALSPEAFEKKVEELDAIEEKKAQERQKAWVQEFYERILHGA